MSKQLILRQKPITPVYQTKLGKLFCGGVLSVLDSLPSESVQCVVTSPPYWGLRDYGIKDQLGLEETPSEYIEKMTLIFTKIKRVLKSDGTLWLNLGDCYNGGGQDSGKTIGIKSQQIRNLKVGDAHPTKSIRIKGLKPKDLVGIPWRVAFALRDSGWYLRQDIIWHKPNPMPESVLDRCTKAHEYIFLMSKSGKYYYDQDSIREITGNEFDPEEYQNNLGEDWQKGRDRKKEDMVMGMMRMPNKPQSGTHPNGRNKRSVWTVNSEPYPDSHFATFPTKLIEPCIRAGSKEGDTVLDPFMGSGTTAYMCEFLNRKWMGIELNPKYCDLAKKRIDQEALKPKLF